MISSIRQQPLIKAFGIHPNINVNTLFLFIYLFCSTLFFLGGGGKERRLKHPSFLTVYALTKPTRSHEV